MDFERLQVPTLPFTCGRHKERTYAIIIATLCMACCCLEEFDSGCATNKYPLVINFEPNPKIIIFHSSYAGGWMTQPQTLFLFWFSALLSRVNLAFVSGSACQSHYVIIASHSLWLCSLKHYALTFI